MTTFKHKYKKIVKAFVIFQHGSISERYFSTLYLLEHFLRAYLRFLEHCFVRSLVEHLRY